MPFRRRSFRRAGGRRLGQMNWAVAWSATSIVLPSGTVLYAPITAQNNLEVSSDQVIQRVRGHVTLHGVGVTVFTPGLVTTALMVEDTKDIAAGAAALADPRGATVVDIEPDKYLYIGAPNDELASLLPNVTAGVDHVDSKAKRKIDVTYQQLVLAVANDSGDTLNVTYYLRTLLKEKV